tara:strand:- start:443 stop:736 length:294 start_codon:yes stop_codon:yes gene_type:complete
MGICLSDLQMQVVAAENGMYPLATAVARFPTPDANCWKNGERGTGTGGGEQLSNHAVAPQSGGQLNPTWVEWLMGFPDGWTDLEDSVTPSSPRSPNL